MAVTKEEIAEALGVETEALVGILQYAGLSSRRAKIAAQLQILVDERAKANAAFDAQIAAKSAELAQADEQLRDGVGK
jgi:hypothetical protein